MLESWRKIFFKRGYIALELISQLVPENKKKEFAEAVMYLAEEIGEGVEVIKHFVSKEVENLGIDQQGVLFRSNTMASKMSSIYFNIVGKQYLRYILSGHIRKVCDINADLELDPAKIGEVPPEQYQARVDAITLIAQQLLNTITCSLDAMPLGLRGVAAAVECVVESRFPGNTNQALGGLLFLRFICPAIVTPAAVGIGIERVPDKAARSLVLVSKILQSTANMVLVEKEAYMAAFNQLIAANQKTLSNFLRSVPCELDNTYTGLPIPQAQQEAALNVILFHVSTYYDAIATRLPSDISLSFETLRALLSPTSNQQVFQRSSVTASQLEVDKKKKAQEQSFDSPRGRKVVDDQKHTKLQNANKQFMKALDSIQKSSSNSSPATALPHNLICTHNRRHTEGAQDHLKLYSSSASRVEHFHSPRGYNSETSRGGHSRTSLSSSHLSKYQEDGPSDVRSEPGDHKHSTRQRSLSNSEHNRRHGERRRSVVSYK